MNRLRQTFNNHRTERHQRKQDALVDYAHNPDTIHPLDKIRTDDKEILGEHARSGLFRDQARKKADKLVNKIGTAEGEKDTVTEREKYLEARRNFTQVRINKLKGRIDKSSDNFFNRRLNGWRREKLRDLEAKNKKRGKAINSVEKKRQEKPEVLRKKIDEIVKKKVDAMYAKAQRIELRRNGIRKHNVVKRAEFLSKLTPQDKKRIVSEAIRQTRKSNIEKGRLDSSYSIYGNVKKAKAKNKLKSREVTEDYGRIIK